MREYALLFLRTKYLRTLQSRTTIKRILIWELFERISLIEHADLNTKNLNSQKFNSALISYHCVAHKWLMDWFVKIISFNFPILMRTLWIKLWSSVHFCSCWVIIRVIFNWLCTDCKDLFNNWFFSIICEDSNTLSAIKNSCTNECNLCRKVYLFNVIWFPKNGRLLFMNGFRLIYFISMVYWKLILELSTQQHFRCACMPTLKGYTCSASWTNWYFSSHVSIMVFGIRSLAAQS